MTGPAARPAVRLADSGPPGPRVSVEVLAELAARLTPRDRAILELLHEHRVFTTHQLAQVFFPSEIKARHRLLQLYRLAAVARARPWTPTGSAPWHFVLGPAGAAVLAAARGVTVAELGYRRDTALDVCHSATLGHLLGVNSFFTTLHALARRRGDGSQLAAWWSERRCNQLWGDLARPDAYGRWQQPGPNGAATEVDFFVEHDTGSETLTRVAGKLAGYAALAETTAVTTPVLFWLPSTRREHSFHQAVGLPEVPVATAVHTPANDADGPAGPVWLPCGSTRPRLTLIQLADAWPGIGRQPRRPTPHSE